MTGRFYLGMDGGGTGCRGRLVDHTGKVLAEAASGAANIATDRAQALHSILAVAQQVAAGHCALEEITAGLGLAGASLSAPRDWIAAHLPFKSARIVQDVETSLIGALNDQDGIIAAIAPEDLRQLALRFHQTGLRRLFQILLGDLQIALRVLEGLRSHGACGRLVRRAHVTTIVAAWVTANGALKLRGNSNPNIRPKPTAISE
mgnify:CR=1 FL=1